MSDDANWKNSRERGAEVTRMSNSEEVVIAWTTIPTTMDGNKFARQLVEDRLAACVSIFQKVQSTYRWDTTTAVNEEHAVMIKTTAMCVRPLERRILELHDYDVPEFVVTAVSDGYGPYLEWVKGEISLQLD